MSQQKAAMLAQGWQPYSINVRGKWYSYRRLDPFASLLGPVAEFVELSKQIPSTDPDKLGAAVGRAIQCQCWASATLTPFFGCPPR
jgi:hypothetical protein